MYFRITSERGPFILRDRGLLGVQVLTSSFYVYPSNSLKFYLNLHTHFLDPILYILLFTKYYFLTIYMLIYMKPFTIYMTYHIQIRQEKT